LVSGSLDVSEHFGILFLDVSLHRLAETTPLIFSAMGSIGWKDNAIVVVLKNSRMLIDDTDLAVQVTSLWILDNRCGIHNVLIGLGNNGNQEVDQYNKDQELIGKPEGVNAINGNVSDSCDPMILAGLMSVPVSGWWWIDITNGILPCLDHDLCVDIDVWISS